MEIDKHKVWLMVGVSVVIIGVLILLMYNSGGVKAGKAIASIVPLTLGVGEMGIDPASATLNTEDEFWVTVKVHAGNNAVTKFDLSVVYDKEKLKVIEISPWVQGHKYDTLSDNGNTVFVSFSAPNDLKLTSMVDLLKIKFKVISAVSGPTTLSLGSSKVLNGQTNLITEEPKSAVFALQGTCVPQCSGKACGDDGCGGSCGNCANGIACQAGVCVKEETKLVTISLNQKTPLTLGSKQYNINYAYYDKVSIFGPAGASPWAEVQIQDQTTTILEWMEGNQWNSVTLTKIKYDLQQNTVSFNLKWQTDLGGFWSEANAVDLTDGTMKESSFADSSIVHPLHLGGKTFGLKMTLEGQLISDPDGTFEPYYEWEKKIFIYDKFNLLYSYVVDGGWHLLMDVGGEKLYISLSTDESKLNLRWVKPDVVEDCTNGIDDDLDDKIDCADSDCKSKVNSEGKMCTHSVTMAGMTYFGWCSPNSCVSSDKSCYSNGALALVGSKNLVCNNNNWLTCVQNTLGSSPDGEFNCVKEGTQFVWKAANGGGACVSSCAGKACGDDGCGGSCGVCLASPICDAQHFNLCVEESGCVGANGYWYDNGCNAQPKAQPSDVAGCGNGIVDVGEECDDHNTIGGDGCSIACNVEKEIDLDNDGIIDSVDNCPKLSNADQKNSDGDELGDACDTTPCGSNAALANGACACNAGFANKDNSWVNGCEACADGYAIVDGKCVVKVTVLKGDVDCSGVVNIIDAIKVKQYALGQITEFKKADGSVCSSGITSADVSCDGKINVISAIKIKQYALGQITEFKKADGTICE